MNMQKIQRKILLEDALAMIFFIDFGLLRSVCCKISYLLTLRYVLKFDNLHMTQCVKIIAGFMANVGSVFIKRLQTLFSTFLAFFCILSERLLRLWYVLLQGSAGFWSDRLDVWQVSHRDLGVVTDGFQRVGACLSSLSVLGIQPPTHTASLLVFVIFLYPCLPYVICN